MINIVDEFLDKYKLKNADYTFLVGFSGGYDSLCLLDILHKLSTKYGFRLVALHLNHNWRGEESRQDETNCKNFCKKNGIDFISEIIDPNIPKTENAAREARYEFFQRHAKNYKNSAIFTAHTRSDNAETIIYRVIKGTGINGLKGILPKRIVDGMPLYRPLMQISKTDIENYCNAKGLVANSDSSNFDISYKRNFIRHKIMPLFKEINDHAEKSIDSLAQLAISESNIVEEYLAVIKKDVFENSRLLSEKFKQLSNDVKQKIIYDLFLKENLDYDYKKISSVLDFINANLNSKSGSRYSITNDLWFFANSKYIYLITKTKSDENKNETPITKEGEYKVSGTDYIFEIKKYSGEDFKFPKENANIAYVSLDKIDFDLKLRTRRAGDIITPFGMDGSMKLKKYLNSKGISQHKKDELILLTQGSEVLWVATVGLSNKLKVVNKPTHVIELNYKKS